jgi:hypothetical protein
MRTNTLFIANISFYVYSMKRNYFAKLYLSSISLKYILLDMKSLSLKLDDNVFAETEKITEGLKIPRNRYINDALEFYNSHHARLLLKKKLGNESLLVRVNSMDVLREMELLEDGSQD